MHGGSASLPRSEKRWRRDDDSKQHLRFVLAKAKISTVNAVKTMAQFANLRPASLNFAGLKDSKAIRARNYDSRERTQSVGWIEHGKHPIESFQVRS